jgi:hypothetical protein
MLYKVVIFWKISNCSVIEMMPSLDNYISYGQDVFVANEQIQGMMFDIIDTVSSTSVDAVVGLIWAGTNDSIGHAKR